MQKNKDIGSKLKKYRKIRRLSQMDVELGIESAFGSISRIESGRVNPTKETIEKIAKLLAFTDRELDYLIGPTSVPPTIEECDLAEREVAEYFHKDALIAYLVDDRFRLITMSQALYRLLDLSDLQIEQVRYKTLVELVINRELGIRKFFENKYEQNLKLIIERFIYEMGHMIDDEFYIKQKELIMADPMASSIWKELNNTKSGIFGYNEHKITFSHGGIELPLRYINEPLAKYKRFVIVEYVPTDELKSLISTVH